MWPSGLTAQALACHGSTHGSDKQATHEAIGCGCQLDQLVYWLGHILPCHISRVTSARGRVMSSPEDARPEDALKTGLGSQVPGLRC